MWRVVLRGIIRHMKGAGGVWFATGTETARWCLENVFKDRAAKVAAAE